MAKTKVSEWSSTASSNTDIDSINIAEGCAPSGINDAIREMMSQLKDFQTGAAGDSFNGPVGTTTAAAGAFTTLSASSTVTLSGGTANGVAYLNGSKVLTTGSALQFDGNNLGLGVTPSAWTGSFRAIQLPDSGVFGTQGQNINVLANATFNAGWKYIATAYATLYSQSAGQHQWYTAPSGTAGNAISFTQAMTLDASGNLMTGTASPYALGSSIRTLTIVGDTTGRGGGWTLRTTDSSNVFSAWVADGNSNIGTLTATPLVLQSNNTERARIDSSGNLTIGSSTPLGGRLNVYGNIFVSSMSTGAGTNALRYNTSNGLISYDTSSARYKDNIRDSVYGLSHVLQMRSAQFEYKDTGRSDVGLIAEELDLIVPELVAKNAEGQPDAVSYDRMVSVLVKAIQEQQALITQLKARLDAANL